MSRRMKRYVMPTGDIELELTLQGFSYPLVSGEPDGNLYLFVEEDEDLYPKPYSFKLFETGEAVDGIYVGTVSDGKNAKHLYWTNAPTYKEFDDGVGSDDVRRESEVSEVSDAGSSGTSDSAS